MLSLRQSKASNLGISNHPKLSICCCLPHLRLAASPRSQLSFSFIARTPSVYQSLARSFAHRGVHPRESVFVLAKDDISNRISFHATLTCRATGGKTICMQKRLPRICRSFVYIRSSRTGGQDHGEPDGTTMLLRGLIPFGNTSICDKGVRHCMGKSNIAPNDRKPRRLAALG